MARSKPDKSGAHLENSEVLPEGSVAVIVTGRLNWPGNEKLMMALPAASVWMVRVPINCWPSPKPESSQSELEKNCSVKVVLGVLLKVP